MQKDCAVLVRAIAAHPRQPELEITISETDKRREFHFAKAVSGPTASAADADGDFNLRHSPVSPASP